MPVSGARPNVRGLVTGGDGADPSYPNTLVPQRDWPIDPTTLRPDPNAPPDLPPMLTNPLTVAATPAAATASALGSMIDRPGDLPAAVRAAYTTASRTPYARSASELPTPSGEARARGTHIPVLPGLMTDLELDPANLIGGGDPATDLAGLGTHLGMAAAAPVLPKALELIRDLTGPAKARAAQMLADRWPGVVKALTKTGTDLTVKGGAARPALALDRVAQNVFDTTMREGGATIHPLTGEAQIPGKSEGFMAGKFSNQSGQTAIIPHAQFSPADVRQFLEQHAQSFAQDPNLAIGAWHNPDDGNVYLDVSKRYPTARKATVAAANQRQPAGLARSLVTGDDGTLKPGPWPKAQEAIFDLQAGESRPVGNLAEFLNSQEFQDRLAQMYHAGSQVMDGKDWWNLYGTALERVYGTERVKPLAGFLAATSPASAPVHNLRAASEYLRRLIKDEPIIQPEFRIPDTAVGWRPGAIGGIYPGDFNRPGTLMPMEETRAPNLQRVAAGNYQDLRMDKVNDMFHALTGEDVGVYDRRYAKLAEDWDRGIYAEGTKDKLKGSMAPAENPDQPMGPGSYALVENAVREGAARHNMPVKKFSSYVWEGIGDTIKRTGELFGMKHPAQSIPESSQGFEGIFNRMVAEKANALGLSIPEFEARLRSGDAELLTAILSTGAGLAAFRQWQQVVDPGTDSGSSPAQPASSTVGTPPRPPRFGSSTPG